MSTPENTAAVLGTSWPEVFRALTVGEDLSDDVAAWAMGEMMAGDATEGQVGGFLLALAAKGVTVPELRGLTEAMVQAANPVHVPGETLDVVGTGGDRLGTVNLSTMSSLVAAGVGAGSSPTCEGNSAEVSEFQVICGAIASMRSS